MCSLEKSSVLRGLPKIQNPDKPWSGIRFVVYRPCSRDSIAKMLGLGGCRKRSYVEGFKTRALPYMVKMRHSWFLGTSESGPQCGATPVKHLRLFWPEFLGCGFAKFTWFKIPLNRLFRGARATSHENQGPAFATGPSCCAVQKSRERKRREHGSDCMDGAAKPAGIASQHCESQISRATISGFGSSLVVAWQVSPGTSYAFCKLYTLPLRTLEQKGPPKTSIQNWTKPWCISPAGKVGVGKGLNVKGKSAKKNRLSAFVLFLHLF